MDIKLSILIATTSERSEIIKPLLQNLADQKHDAVEVIINDHETDCVGKKRNDMLLKAVGEYVVHVDSDDHISENYVDVILKAIETNPDCVGTRGFITTNGTNKMDWYISKEYGGWYQKGNVYYRTPNHISPIRREHALKAMFPEITFGEDYAFSMAVLPYLKTEIIIDQHLYHYDYRKK